jgi:sugar diacid utilization regulator
MARGARLADLLPSIARELCVSCWVCSATGRVLAGTGSLPQPIADRLISAFLHAERLPTTVTLDRREFLLLQVAGRPEHRLAAWCLVCEGPHAAEPPPAEAADELLGLVTMERARIDQVRGADRRGAAELIRVLVNPSDQSDLRAALRACRLSPDATHVVAMASVIAADSGPTAKLATYLLEDLVRPLSAHTAVGRVGDTAMAVLTPKPEAVAGMVEALRGSASSLAPALHGHRLVIGLSGIARGAHALTGAAEQARHTHDAAVCLTEPVSVVSSVDLASHVLLLASVGPEMRQSFRSLLLGPLIDYDRAHHANLVGTLDAFLRSSGSWQRCADEMHVHVNTLRYRLERVEQLTGRDLSRFEDRVDFFLALRLPA